MSTLARLKAATSLQDVAGVLGFQAQALAFILYKKHPAQKYAHFSIPKRSGGVRTISTPYPALMLLQSRLSDLLQNCIAEINKTRKIESALSHGFRRKYSIITNASMHRRRRYVFNVDLENFFGVINFGRVRGFFIKNRHFELAPRVATILAQIACHNNALPQGSPCSPVLSNLIGHVLDIRLAALAHRVGCSYSRYADDLTFSTSKLIFPLEVAQRVEGTEHQWRAGDDLESIILRSGFVINAGKTRMQYAGSRQDVTGLIVNSRVNTRAEYRRRARAMVHRLLKTGKFHVKRTGRDQDGSIAVTEVDGSLHQLNGMLSFVDSVDCYSKGKSLGSMSDIESSGKVYRRFLFYKNFYAAAAPVIVCEGKTDNIYIRSAIRRLVDSYPRLAQRKAGGGVRLGIRLFRYTQTTKRLLGLAGGTGHLPAFIHQYGRACSEIESAGMEHPVIVVVDNDDGARSIYNAINSINKGSVKRDGSALFYHVSHNLYVVPIPLRGRSSATIEDCFDGDVKSTQVGGKSFNPKDNGFNRRTEYGKYVFAEQVVKKHEERIDFAGFGPLLDGIDAVVRHHSARLPPAAVV